ncbi:Uncharacterised protein [Yersinia enterocolitica]|nr:Uncharacterised protein [Yersinia mollaretii]CNK68488.1 Uncharacterised protein [Yersinia enterocolitica]CQQ50997.1 Uncharacterised protein [Yersinia mollaretii]
MVVWEEADREINSYPDPKMQSPQGFPSLFSQPTSI